MNRRDFLRPERLLHTAAQVLGVQEHLSGLDLLQLEPEPEVALLRYGRRAMATTFEVLLPLGTSEAPAACEAVLDEIDRLESQMTVYRDDSEVSRLNRLAASALVQVEEGLFNLLARAERITRQTEGAFDVSVGALIKAWGFYRRRGRVPSPEERADLRNKIGMHNVVLGPENRTVGFRCASLELNLGSIGKGYALDRVGRLLRDRWRIETALLHGGHSSVLALGSQPGTGRGWTVGIRHPAFPERRLGMVHLRNRAMATSAATFQHLEYQGRKLGHILDPRTCWPAEGVQSASVTAPTGAEADALATAFYVLGVDKARAYCAEHPEIGVILLPKGQSRPELLGYARQETDLA